jgi:beta-lactamase class A
MRLVRRVFAATLFLLLGAMVSRADAIVEPGPLGDLQLQLATMSRHAPGSVGIMVEDLTTGASTSVNAGAQMPAASTIKIPVMVEVFKRLERGDFDLNRNVTLLAGDRDWGYGDLSDATVGTRYTVSNLLHLMIDESDNTATNMLIRLVGRQAINQTMASLGLDQTYLRDFIRSDGPIRYALRSSPQDMIHLLDAMAHNRLVDEWSSREMIAILTGQHHNGLIPEPLPAGTVIAHKTGTLHDTLNDVGIVFLNQAPYAIAVMTTNLPTLDAGYRFIRGVSRVAYDELERVATFREANAAPALPAMPAVPAVTTQPATELPPHDDGGLEMWTPLRPAPASPDDTATGGTVSGT